MEHGPGNVGISSRWWYLPGMYKPAAHCSRCTEPTTSHPGLAFSQSLRRITSKRSPVPAVDVDVSGRQSVVSKTQELYRVPRIAVGPRPVTWAKEVVTWPRYAGGAYRLGGS